MNNIWTARNSGADTEERLIAATLRILVDSVNNYGTQSNIVAIDRNDILNLAKELEE